MPCMGRCKAGASRRDPWRVTCTVTYSAVRFQNIGPIESGEVRRHPVTVFVGPTGSGKSIAARLMHGACLVDPSRVPYQMDLHIDRQAAAERIMSYVGHTIMKSAGIPASSAPTHNKPLSSLEVVMDRLKCQKIDCMRLGRLPAPDGDSALSGNLNDGPVPSVYVPAGRTGIVQSFVNTIRLRSEMLRRALTQEQNSGGTAARKSPEQKTPQSAQRATAHLHLPEHLEAFYDAIFPSLTGSPTSEGCKAFSEIFPGSVVKSSAAGTPTTAYRSPDGFEAEITSAASGMLSSFPILECMRRVQKDGLLVVEEPEAHLEPVRQLHLVEELAKMAKAKPFGLVLITHSDYTLDSVLSLVARRVLRHSELGLYYFERKNGPYARIRRLPVDDDGSAEQDLFEDALALLRRRFT